MSQADPALPTAVADLLRSVIVAADRASPLVFAGRDGEFALLRQVVEGVGGGFPGQTAVVFGVPGVGKSALRWEFRNRLLATVDDPVAIGIPLRPGDLDKAPLDLVKAMDQELRSIGDGGVVRVLNEAVDVGKRALSLLARQDAWAGTLGVDANSTLKAVLDKYLEAGLNVNRRQATLLLLVDEAQNIPDTPQARANLDSLHGADFGRAKAGLVCFGLHDTRQHLADLGLSRLAADRVVRLGALSAKEANRLVEESLTAIAYADGEAKWRAYLAACGLGEDEWTCWRSSVADTILAESADFPHHLANGMRELAKIIHVEGVTGVPPIKTLRRRCGERRRDYYDHRLAEFKDHTVALGAAFSHADHRDAAREDLVLSALMATNNRGRAVSATAAEKVIVGMIANGFLESTNGMLRVALPSLATYLNEEYRARPQDHAAVRNLQKALPRATRRRQG